MNIKLLTLISMALVTLGVTADVRKYEDIGQYDPRYDLSPGLKFKCKVKFPEGSDPEGTTIFEKMRWGESGGYFLRVDGKPESTFFSFFAETDGSIEPRTTIAEWVKGGIWYDIECGWDGENIFLSVNGKKAKCKRKGQGGHCRAPFKLYGNKGKFEVKDFTVENGVINEDKSLAQGWQMACRLVFEKKPKGENELLRKRGEYMLRYDSTSWGDFLNMYLFLDGHWEPHVEYKLDNPEIGKPYDISAEWNGEKIYLRVGNIERTKDRIGTPKHSDFQLETIPVEKTGVKVIDPVVSVRREAKPVLWSIHPKDLFPRAGKPMKMTAILENRGSLPFKGGEIKTSTNAKGVIIEPMAMKISEMAPGEKRNVDWTVDCGNELSPQLRFVIKGEDGTQYGYFSACANIMPKDDPDYAHFQPKVSGKRTYYIDSVGGDDRQDGLSSATAWRSFKNTVGLKLGPGERLLLKRGSEFRDELIISMNGTKDDWAEVGAYGEGMMPIIRRHRDIEDRCMFVENPTYAVVHDLIVCNACCGITMWAENDKYRGVLVERILAHHIGGGYRFNSHGIPEWRDRKPPKHGSSGVVIGHGAIGEVTLRDCEMYQCSKGYSMQGWDSAIHRVNCHDSLQHNTSPHPTFTSTTRSWLTDSIFDKSGWHASCGTMGIMLGDNKGLIIRGCYFINQPDSGSGDEGGIDFEAFGDNCIIENCTFRNNAGAAIEVLGLNCPQARNTWIRNCRFDRNNWRCDLGPSEVFVWGSTTSTRVLCSSGLVEDNGYVLAPGVQFYTNQAERTRANWIVRNNRQFGTSAELNKAMPFNEPPDVAVGKEIWTKDSQVELNAEIGDDGGIDKLKIAWEQIEGPANSRIISLGGAKAKAALPVKGDYRFRIKVDDGQYWKTARIAVHAIDSSFKMRYAWDFSRNLNNEGWTYADLGTVKEEFDDGTSNGYTFADPVHLVCGDYYELAIKDSNKPRLYSSDWMMFVPQVVNAARIKLQNHTNSTKMRLCYMTSTSRKWTRANSVVFEVKPMDDEDSIYEVPIKLGTSKLQQMRLDFSAEGEKITGTVRIDYICIGHRK